MLSHSEAENLQPLLEDLLDGCNLAERRPHDPVEFVWEYPERHDRELVGLLSSCLAYGRVELVKRAIKQVLEVLGSRPARMLDRTSPASLTDALADFVYRMTRGPDVVDLLVAAHRLQQEFGGLQAAYLDGAGETHTSRASSLVGQLRRRRVREESTRGLRYLLPDPADGSACKRLQLFFRWMGRGPNGIDLGLWSALDPSVLIMPLDAHTSRLCRYVGLTDRKSTDLKAALEVTRSLALMAPEDPLKYDFALCHLGISGACIHQRSPDHCPTCPIESVCRL